jgi:hypothetical protein
MRIQRKTLGLLVLAALIAGWPLAQLAAEDDDLKTVVALGWGEGSGGKARDRAIDDALRKAVEQGVGLTLESETTMSQMQLLEDRIYTESRGYIQGYDILQEGAKETDLYEVEVSARVRMAKLADDLEAIGLLIRKKRNPRVMVIIYGRETSEGVWRLEREGSRRAENQIEQMLKEKGFQLVDAGQVARKQQLTQLMVDGQSSQAAQIASNLGAEIIFEGEVRRQFLNRRVVFGRAMNFYNNEVRLKALETDTARVLYSGEQTGTPTGGANLEAIDEMVAEVAEEVIAGMLSTWREDVFQASRYQIELAGVTFKKLSKFKSALKDLRGTQEVQTRHFDAGKALVEIQFRGSVEDLVDQIGGLSAPEPEITGFQANTIQVSLP